MFPPWAKHIVDSANSYSPTVSKEQQIGGLAQSRVLSLAAPTGRGANYEWWVRSQQAVNGSTQQSVKGTLIKCELLKPLESS